VKRRFTLFATGILTGLVGWSACGSSPEPGILFDEAEGLRAKYEKGASEQAIAKYQEALVVWQRRGDKRRAARTAQQIGATYGQLGSLHESLRSYQVAASLARESLDSLLQSDIGSDLGIAQTLVSDREDAFDTAQKHCQEAIDLARQAAGDRELAKALNCLGEVAYHRQSADHALEFYREAQRVWDRLGDRRGQAETLLFQGYAYSDLSKFDLAQSSYERARSLWIPLNDKRQQAITLVADARLHVRRGEYQEALNRFDRALTLLQPMGDAVWEGSSLTGMARAYRDMAENRSALKYWDRALRLFQKAGLNTNAADVLGSLGETYLALGDDANALKQFERALALADVQGIKYWRAKALQLIGVVYLVRQQAREAEQYLDRSLAVQESLGDAGYLRLRARTRADLGEAHGVLGEHDVALKYFNEAIALSRTAGDRVTEARGLFGLARISVRLNDLSAARRSIEHALDVAESLRTGVENSDLRASYFASVYQWHELHVDVMMRLNKIHPKSGLAVNAFEASERARARSLLESLAEAKVDLRAGVEPDLLKREQVLKKAFDDWAKRERGSTTKSVPKAEAEALAEEYRDLEYRYNQVQAEIRSNRLRHAAFVRPQAVSLKTIQTQLLDPETLLLEYSLGEERSYLWLVSNKYHISRELPPRAEIERGAQRVHELLTARLTVTGDVQERRRRAEQADTEYWQEAARLSEMLLGPVAKKIVGKRLLVVTDGALQSLPFAALPVPGNRDKSVPMVAAHEIVNLPSATVLAALRLQMVGNKQPSKTVAVLADPVFEFDDPRLPAASDAAGRPARQGPAVATVADNSPAQTQALRDAGVMRDGTLTIRRLISSRAEADDIVSTAPEGMTLKALGFDASRATAMSPELAEYRIVHFATHGVLNNEDPGLSGIVLSMFDKQGRPQDGFLRLHDIYGLKLPAELVVLSACNTALGKPVRGEGLVGMVRGFMYAGAKRVVASYWKVDDEATGQLMGRFYMELLKQNRTPAAALRQAQLAMMQHDRWRPPFYWAAFALQGEWR
jgi:CHAT domain-containing protein